MKNNIKKTWVSRKNAISIFSSIICFLILSFLFMGLTKHDLEVEKESFSYIAKNEAEHIVTTIDCVDVVIDET
ncbi:MAG: hypothetical protein IJ727_12100 [Treponema sp.]|nr:hypothetical protein [Treponema sp.]